MTGIQFCSSSINSLFFLLCAKLYKSVNCIIKNRLPQQLTVANKDISDDVNKLALDLYRAIVSIHYKRIEQLVRKGREKELLKIKDSKGNTFIHLVALLIERFSFLNEDIPDIDDSAPLIQDVINIFQSSFLPLCKIINSNLFPCFFRFSMI